MAFPSDVTQQTSTSAAIAATNVVTYYEKVGLERLLPRLRHAQVAEKKPLPKNSGRTIQWYRFRRRTAIATNLTEMVVPSRSTISADSITATLIQRGGYVAFSDMVSMTAIDPMLEDAAALMGEEAAQTIDRYIRDIIGVNVGFDAAAKSSIFHGAITYGVSGATQRVYTGITPTNTAGTGFLPAFPMLHNKVRVLQSALISSFAGSSISVRTIQHAISFLKANNAMPYDDGKFVGIIHPDNTFFMQTAAGWKSWHAYTTPESMYKGEIGEISGCRFVESTEALKVRLSGDTSSTASGWLYNTIIVGKGAYGLTEVDGGFKVFVNEAGSAGSADALHQINTVGWKWTGVARILNKSAGVSVLTTGSATLGC